MRRLSVVLLCLLWHTVFFAQTNNPNLPQFEEGKLYVKFLDGLGLDIAYLGDQSPNHLPFMFQTSQLTELLNNAGVTSFQKAFTTNQAKLTDVFVLEFSNPSLTKQSTKELTKQLIKQLEQVDLVDYVEAVPIVYTNPYTPNDPDFATNQWNLTQINAPDAWDITKGCNNTDGCDNDVVIAIVDDAVLLTHEDLQANIWVNPCEIPNNGIDDDGNGYIDDINGWDLANGDNDPNPPASATSSIFSHGTHCAGIASAVTDNTIGIASIGFQTRIMAVKTAPDASTGNSLPAAYQGVLYAIDAGADVISMSWGGSGSSATNQLIMDAAHNAGIILVAAAGNDNAEDPPFPHYPSAYNHVISVGASDNSDQKASFSNYGVSVDVMAPGVSIWSTVAGANNAYGFKNGTSMACPLISGVAGLMLCRAPHISPDQLEDCLKSTADDIDAQNPTYIGKLGAGRVNAQLALACLDGPPIARCSVSDTLICPGGSVTFTDESIGVDINAWNWSFPGGTPSSSTAQHPTVTYAASGIYDLTLMVTNPHGSHDTLKTSVVSVVVPTAAITSNDAILRSGDPFPIIVAFTGQGPWKFSYTDGTTTTTITDIDRNPYVIVEHPTADATYALVDMCSVQCAGDAFGSTSVEISDCEYRPGSKTPFQVEQEWETNRNSVLWDDYSVPMVGDMDGDGIPEIIGRDVNYIRYDAVNMQQIYSTTVSIVNGEDGSLQHDFLLRNANNDTIAVNDRNVHIAIGEMDLTGDSFREIVVNTRDRYLYCYNHDGTLIWQSSTTYNAHIKATPGIADFNKDGMPEVYIGNQIFNGQTGVLLATGTGSRGAQSGGNTFSVAADVLPDNFCLDCSGLELIAGNHAYSISATWGMNIETMADNTQPFVGDGSTTIADVNLDGNLDALVTRAGVYVYVWDIQTSTLLTEVYSPISGGGVGQSNIANFDSDPQLEVGIAVRNQYKVLEIDFNNSPATFREKWSKDTNDGSAEVGSSVFDFQCDGVFEVIYRDERQLYVFAGTSGDVITSFPCGSITATEYPVVADIDNDGETEIICSCQDNGGILKAYKSANLPWASSRKVWNQGSYFIANVNDDLTIPSEIDSFWLNELTNNFLNQRIDTCGNDSLFNAADLVLTIQNTTCIDNTTEITLEVCNEGITDLPANTPISFYNGNPSQEKAVLVTTGSLGQVFEVDSCRNLSFSISFTEDISLCIVGNDSGFAADDLPFDFAIDFPQTGIGECNFYNNIDCTPIDISAIDAGPIDTLMCEGETIQLQAIGAGAGSYSWTPTTGLDNPNIANPNCSASQTTTYYVTTTDANNCSATDSITVIVASLPVPIDMESSVSACKGERIPLNDSDPIADYSYRWSPTTNLSDPFTSNPTVTVNGNVTYMLTITNRDGCSITQSVNVIDARCCVSSVADFSATTNHCASEGSILPQVPDTSVILSMIDDPDKAIINWSSNPTTPVNYTGDNCTHQEYSYTLTISCTEDPTVALDGGTITIRIYPEISASTTQIIGNGTCEPTLSVACSNYTVQNSLDNNGATPDYTDIEGAGTITFTVTNPAAQANGVSATCISNNYVANYACCPMLKGSDFSADYYYCASEGSIIPPVPSDSAILANVTSPTEAIIQWSTDPTVAVSYNGDNCLAQTFSYNLTIGCISDASVAVDGGTITLTIYPTINAANHVLTNDGGCGPTLSVPCTNYSITNSLDNNGNTPDWSVINGRGTIDFTITNPEAQANGVATTCVTQVFTADYACCATTIGNFTADHLWCASETPQLPPLPTDAEVLASLDVPDQAQIQWSQDASIPISYDYATGGCEAQTFMYTLTVTCATNPSVALFGGTITVVVYPAVEGSLNTIIGGGTCAVSLLFSCPNYVVTNDFDNNGATPDWEGVNGQGNITFTVTNPTAPEALANSCLVENYTATYKCCIAEAGTLNVTDKLCPLEDIVVSTQDEFGNPTHQLDADYVQQYLLLNAAGEIIEMVDATTEAVVFDRPPGEYGVCSFNYQLAEAPQPMPVLGGLTNTIGTIEAGCFDLTCWETLIVVPEDFVFSSQNIDEGNNGGVTPFFYNTHEIQISGGTGSYEYDWDKIGYVRYNIRPNYNTPEVAIEVIYSDNATWSLSVTDAHGCTADVQGNPLIFGNNGGNNSILDIDHFEIKPYVNDNDMGQIAIWISGGDDACGEYTCKWAGPYGFNATDEDISQLRKGWYSVVITDCSGDQTEGWYWVPEGGPADNGFVRGKQVESATTMLTCAPNPTTHTTLVRFQMPTTEIVNISVYTATGQLIRELFTGTAQQGQYYEVPFDAANWASGIYLVRLTTHSGDSKYEKLVLTK